MKGTSLPLLAVCRQRPLPLGPKFPKFSTIPGGPGLAVRPLLPPGGNEAHLGGGGGMGGWGRQQQTPQLRRCHQAGGWPGSGPQALKTAEPWSGLLSLGVGLRPLWDCKSHGSLKKDSSGRFWTCLRQ